MALFRLKNVFSVEIRRVSFRLSIIWASYLKNGPSYDCLQISKIGQNWPKLAKIGQNHENDRFWASDPRNGFPGQIEVFPGSSGCSTAEISSKSGKIALKRPQTGLPRPLKRQIT